MMKSGGHICIIALSLLIGHSSSQLSDDWIKQKLELGLDVAFTCNDTDWPEERPPDDSVPIGWILPGLVYVDKTYNDTRRWVSDDGHQLDVTAIEKSDLGVYHCVMQSQDGSRFLIKWGLNMKGPYFEDLWEKYRMRTIIGLSAGFGFAFLAVVVLLINAYRWKAPEEDDDTSMDVIPTIPKVGYINHGFDVEKKNAERMTPEPDYHQSPRSYNGMTAHNRAAASSNRDEEVYDSAKFETHM